MPVGEAERQALAEDIGRDGAGQLVALFDPTAPQWLCHVPAADTLRQVWVQNYFYEDGQIRWRTNENIPPPARYLGSPYDEEAH